jgi:hypothetical protein
VNTTLMLHFARQRLQSPQRLLLFFLAFAPPIVMAGIAGSLAPVQAGAAMFALIFTAGAIGQDMSSGVLQLLFARPVARTTYVLSRWFTGGLIGAVLGIAQTLLAVMAIMGRGGATDPSAILRLVLENAISGFGTAAVMVMLSSMVNGLGDVALWAAGLLTAQMLGLAAGAKQWQWLDRVASEMRAFLQPDLSLGWMFGNGDLSWAALLRFFAAIAVGLAVAVTLMQRKELSYAAD